ncbi:MAG: AP2 domain-containing protein [Methanogenium sp.]|jgi:hypothetical protein
MNCKVEGCLYNEVEGKVRIVLGYCTKHYQQMRKFGKIVRTTRDSNEYVIKNDVCFIKLYDSSNKEREEKAVIDKEDYAKIKEYRWCFFPGGYVWNNANKTFLHNVLMGSKNIDHINGDGLDNRKCNLRLANQSQNNMNKRLSKCNSSGFKGVHYDKQSGKWIVQIRKERKLAFKASVHSKEEAAKLYDKKVKELFGKFARTNHMEGRI